MMGHHRWLLAALVAVIVLGTDGSLIGSKIAQWAGAERQPQIAASQQLNHILNERSPAALAKLSGDDATYTYQQLKQYRHRRVTVSNFSDDQGGGSLLYFVGTMGRYTHVDFQMRAVTRRGQTRYVLTRIEISPGDEQ
ncbi:hypothetical protein [Schleiferilactobacillus shenzhenensis]|nr:hypothetical protein [Schleiferilactobacillus shenzhenensis]